VALAPGTKVVCGMSLGGTTAIALAHTRPELVRRLAVVDVAPSSGRERSGAIFDFIAGPEEFASLDELIERTMSFAPNRSRASLTVGVLHNAHAQPDGKWRWRYDPTIGSGLKVADVGEAMLGMWDAIEAIKAPTLLVKGADSPSVSDDAIEEWRRRQSHVRVVVVPDAGHSVQSDQPLVLAALLAELSDR
jgi:pimeloyl-ACP methyl ester carboxylesterase